MTSQDDVVGGIAGDLALLMDTSHPMIRPQLEKAMDRARRTMQAQRRFCIQVGPTGSQLAPCLSAAV